ncbi:ribonuclease HII [[Mycoplasma] testudinis]|uniref:ribonuclease HII n=1 Tax=[Mycoplasma] testudinis TaxID=33924 RepID=UPI00055D7C8C|nr:ribonuclease HII [[Mycoplasma] testudinis]
MKFNEAYLFDRCNYKPTDLVLGIDEVGRGCWAGPLVVCGVILKPRYFNPLITDSKLLSDIKRRLLSKEIIANTIDYKIAIISVKDVDLLGPKKASIKGMIEIIQTLGLKANRILVDYEQVKIDNLNIEGIVHGDKKSYTISAASIIAKVYRDDLLIDIDQTYPQYGFKNHKGYGTKQHLQALIKYGPIKDYHRFSYKPISDLKKKKQ